MRLALLAPLIAVALTAAVARSTAQTTGQPAQPGAKPATTSTATTAQTTAQADAVCARCHGEIVRRYLKTPMANASGPALDHVLTGSFHHAASNIDYRFFTEPGPAGETAWMSYRSATDPAITGRYRLQYFLGSGHLGLTYLYSTDGYWFETPVANYARLAGFDMKPGYGTSHEMPPALPMTSECMRCHMSGVQREDRGTRNHFSGAPFLQGGITCESCHGDTRPHVASNGKAAVINPARLDAERRDSVCISCHLEGDTNVEHRDRSALDYHPGERIADYVSYYTFSSGDARARGVSEIEQLEQSKCKRVSGDRMSCMSCHDPHFTPAPEERAAFYRARCLACHTEPKFASSHHAATPDCTSCHMPKTSANNIPHVAWTDHRLRAHPDAPELLPLNAAAATHELRPLLSSDTTDRDLGLAYYNLISSAPLQDRDRARQLLSAANTAHPGDPAVLTALGVLADMAAQQAKQNGAEAQAQAADYYREALARSPADSVAATNLGRLLARSGQLGPAIELWQSAFAHNQDIPELGINLALAQCLTGRGTDAQETLARVLRYSPGDTVALRKLRALRAGEETCSSR